MLESSTFFFKLSYRSSALFWRSVLILDKYVCLKEDFFKRNTLLKSACLEEVLSACPGEYMLLSKKCASFGKVCLSWRSTLFLEKYSCLEEVLYVCLGEVVYVCLGEVVYVCLGEVVYACLGEVVYACLGEVVYVCLGEVVYVCLGEVVYACLGEVVYACLGEVVYVCLGEVVYACLQEVRLSCYIAGCKKGMPTGTFLIKVLQQEQQQPLYYC